jgi:hypothetical protein
MRQRTCRKSFEGFVDALRALVVAALTVRVPDPELVDTRVSYDVV